MSDVSPFAGDPNVLDLGDVTLRPGDTIGPYTYRRQAGRGGMAWIVAAEDPNGETVALKLLRGGRSETALPRFKREFKALSRIHHPNVIRVYSYGEFHSHPYIAMEYVEGVDLHETIRGFKGRPSQQRWRRSEEILVDLARALSHVHQRGLVHRDLKPSNVLITAQGQAKLTDFGIVKDLDPAADPWQSTTVVGTWAYAAPEQIWGKAVDHRADLYSLGVILFAMLTSRRPFAGRSFVDYRKVHLQQEPPRPTDVHPDVPPHLDDICARLLQKDRRKRFQSAREILYQLEQLGAELSIPSLRWEPPLVGREAASERIHQAVDGLTRREGGVILIEGPEGVGRSRALTIGAQRASLIGFPVLRVGQSEGALSFEGLSKALGLNDAAELYGALDERLDDGPQVLLFDDLQDASAEDRRLLMSLVQGLTERGLLTLIACRGEPPTREIEALNHQGALDDAARIRLTSLDREHVRSMMEQLLREPESARVLADRLFGVAQGSPLFITQFLSALLQRGDLVLTPQGFAPTSDVDEIAAGHLEIPPAIRQLLRRRLDGLERSARQVLELLSIHGAPMDLDLMLDMFDDGDQEEEILDAIDQLIARGLVIESRLGDKVRHDTTHRLLGDVVYRDLHQDERTRLHRQLAARLEVTRPDAIALVGHHYQLAGESGLGYHYLTIAAVQALRSGQPASAWEMTSRATTLEDMAQAELESAIFQAARLRLLRSRAELHRGRAEWSDAQRCLELCVVAAEEAGDADTARRARIALGPIIRRNGGESPRAPVLAALTSARDVHDRRAVASALAALAELDLADGDAGACLARVEEGLVLAPQQATIRGELLYILASAQSAQGNTASAMSSIEEAIGALLGRGQRQLRCAAICRRSELQISCGQLELAAAGALEALEISQRLNYRLGQIEAEWLLGLGELEAGHLEEADAPLRRALLLSDGAGDANSLLAIRYALARLAAATGDVEALDVQLGVARGLSEQPHLRHYRPALQGLLAWRYLCGGHVRDAEQVLGSIEDALSTLPVHWACRAAVSAAQVWSELGNAEAVQRLALGVVQASAPRELLLSALDARALLVAYTSGSNARAWSVEAAGLEARLRGMGLSRRPGLAPRER